MLTHFDTKIQKGGPKAFECYWQFFYSANIFMETDKKGTMTPLLISEIRQVLTLDLNLENVLSGGQQLVVLN